MNGRPSGPTASDRQTAGEIDRFREISAAVRQGTETRFWEVLCDLLDAWSAQAKEDLLLTDPADVGRIAQLQMEARVYRGVRSRVESIAQEHDVRTVQDVSPRRGSSTADEYPGR